MADNLQKLIALARADGGRFFVLDENGQPMLVMMSIEEYEKMLVKKMNSQTQEIEEVSRAIAESQAAARAQAAVERRQEEQDALKSEIIDSTFLME